MLTSEYSKVHIIAAGADAVDLALINLCRKGDIVVTQDYGVAALALGKKAYAIHQNGWQYTNENIDRLLMERHISKRARRANKKVHLKGPAKRTEDDDAMFVNGLTSLITSFKMSPTSLGGGKQTLIAGEHISQLVETLIGRFFFLKKKNLNNGVIRTVGDIDV